MVSETGKVYIRAQYSAISNLKNFIYSHASMKSWHN